MSDKGVPENFIKRRARDATLKDEADKLRVKRRAEIKVLRESWVKKA
jgi:large subunit ribosomal protein L7e